MKPETHVEANRLSIEIEKVSKHLQSIIDVIEKIESYSGTQGEGAYVGLFNERVRIGKDNALMILFSSQKQAEMKLAGLQTKYDNL
jgi:hypothetical protein